MHNKILKKFTEHPNSLGESYLKHLKFAFKISFQSFQISIFAFIHGIFPFLFVYSASDRLEKLHKSIALRRGHEEKSLNNCCSK